MARELREENMKMQKQQTYGVSKLRKERGRYGGAEAEKEIDPIFCSTIPPALGS